MGASHFCNCASLFKLLISQQGLKGVARRTQYNIRKLPLAVWVHVTYTSQRNLTEIFWPPIRSSFHHAKIHTSSPLAVVSLEISRFVAASVEAGHGLGVTNTIFSQSESLPNTFKNWGWFTQVSNHLLTFTSDFLVEGSKTYRETDTNI